MLSSGRTVRHGILAALTAAAWCAAAAAPAAAGTVSSGANGLAYSDFPGESNRALFVWDATGVLVSDTGATVVVGCLPLTLTEVRCTPEDPPLFGSGAFGCDPCFANMSLGDRDDSGEIRNAPSRSTLSVRVDGGDGDDRLSANRGTILGGPGDDELTGEFLDGGPGVDRLTGTDADDVLSGGADADAMRGMGGTDRVSYAERAEGVRVTLDDRADDGAAGEGDDVQAEDVNGGAGADVIVGDQARNALTGLCGADRIEGGAGDDVLEGGAGADVLDGGTGDDVIHSAAGPFGDPRPPAAPCGRQAATAASDRVACGPGDDLVLAAAGDRVAADCERVYFGGRAAPRLTIGRSARLRRARSEVALTIRDITPVQESGIPLATGIFPVSGTVVLRVVQGAPRGPLGRAALPRLGRGATAQVAVPLTGAARRALGRRGAALRVAVTLSARAATGARSLTRRTVLVSRR